MGDDHDEDTKGNEGTCFFFFFFFLFFNIRFSIIPFSPSMATAVILNYFRFPIQEQFEKDGVNVEELLKEEAKTKKDGVHTVQYASTGKASW